MIKLNQKGMTLVELLAVIVISSIILSIGYSILFSMLKSGNQQTIQIQMRNEAVLISQQFDQAMLNIDEIVPPANTDTSSMFTNFTAVNNTIDQNLQPIEVDIPIAINNGNLFINNKVINSNNYSLQNTTFKYINGYLQVYFSISDLKNNQQFQFFKQYKLKSE